jgi:hypothetical protein
MTDTANAETIRVKFGIKDDEGREIGCIVRIWELPHPSWNALGSRWKLEPHATRDGEPYGATPVRSFGIFTTLAAARAAAQDYIDGAIHRARARSRGAL